MALPLPVGTTGVSYSASFTVNNATFASIASLPSGLTATYAVSGVNIDVTISGTPLVTFNGNVQVTAENAASGCTTTGMIALDAGNLRIQNPCTLPTLV